MTFPLFLWPVNFFPPNRHIIDSSIVSSNRIMKTEDESFGRGISLSIAHALDRLSSLECQWIYVWFWEATFFPAFSVFLQDPASKAIFWPKKSKKQGRNIKFLRPGESKSTVLQYRYDILYRYLDSCFWIQRSKQLQWI